MSEHKFKVGDRVRIKDDAWNTAEGDYGQPTPGDVATIDEILYNELRFWGTAPRTLAPAFYYDYEVEPAPARAYLAGPMRGLPEYNFPAFLAAEAQLKEAGIEVFNPAQHDIDNGFDYHGLTGHEDLSEHGFDLRKALGADVNFIAHESTGVILLPGWEKSSGARAEVALAKALSLPVVTLEGALHEGGLDAPQVVLWSDPDETSLRQQRDAIQKVINNVVSVTENPSWSSTQWPAPRVLSDHEISFKGALLTGPGTPFTGEVRSVSSTGAEKGVKPERLDLLPTQALSAVARHYGVGAAKYADHNWRKGYEWSKSYAALQRHANAFWGGEDIDEETGSPHMAAVAFHALALLTFMEEQPGFDDRYKKEAA